MSAQDDQYIAGFSGPISKRRRIALACNACRMRKSRCNGQRPSCSSCTGLGAVCHYEPADTATNILVRKEQLSDLEHRLAANERKLQQVDALLRGHLSRCDDGHQNARSSSAAPSESPYHAEDLEEPPDEDATTNGMAMTFLEERMSAFFGESSNLSFTRFLLRATAALNQPSYSANTTLDCITVEKGMAKLSRVESPSTHMSGRHRDSAITSLPPADVMEKMLDLYFEHPGYVFSFVHEPTTRQQYAEFKLNGFSKARRTWLGLLNMIFALASKFDLVENDLASGRTRSERSDVFYQRANGLCNELSKHVVSLEIIQYLVLVVLHCQGTQRSTQAWNTFGLLVRSATALGLHSVHKDADSVAQETRRRTWLVIYGLDRLLSMVFGRPMAIMDEQMSAIPVSTAFSDAPTDSDAFAGQFLDISSQLYQILGSSLIKQYGANVENNGLDADPFVLMQRSEEIGRALRAWTTSLPSYLQLCQPDSDVLLKNSKTNRLQVILTLRYHNLNILIHRPLLGTAIRNLSRRDVSSYTAQAVRAGAAECVHSAKLIINMVHSIVLADPTSRNNLGIWFFTLFYVFTSSLIICGDSLLSKYSQDHEDAASVAHRQALLDKCEVIFQKLNHDDNLVYSCAQYIRNLSDLYISRGKVTSHDNSGLHNVTRLPEIGETFPFMPDTLGIMHLNAEDMDAFLASEMIDPSIFEGL